MNRPGKTALKIAACSFLLLALVACGQSKKPIESEEYVKPVYEEQVVFVGTFDASHIDVLAGEVKKMYAIPEHLKDTVKSFKEEDVLIVEYTLDNELKRNVENVRLVGTQQVVQEQKEVAKANKTDKPTEPIKVYRGGEWVEEEATVTASDSGYSIRLLDGYKLEGGSVVAEADSLYQVEISELEADAEIKPERWAAADVLKKIGDLKELKGEQIYDPNFRDAEFVFTSRGGEIAKNVVVRKEGERLIRYTMTYPAKDTEHQTEAALWAMMESLEFE